MDILPVRRALLSVSDKSGLLDLARALIAHGATLISTGGTARDLREAGLAVTDVATVSGFPEILDGRVKTLVPQIHGAILGRRDDPAHLAQMQTHGIAPIDLVVVNLYPFERTVAAGADEAGCVEMIDIGGPALLRAAAKNHAHVAVLSDPAQYAETMAALAAGGTSLALRRRLAGAAYARTAAYDAAIAGWFAGDPLPPHLVLSAPLQRRLRYGENPHQQAALYALPGTTAGVVSARQIQGKELSYNNLADADAALACVAEFDRPAIVIVKHANPCGVAVADALLPAWRAALAGDPVSAFGGIVAANRTLDEASAAAIAEIFTEVIVAPHASDAALAVLAQKRNLRVLLTGTVPDPAATGVVIRSVTGGLLLQTPDVARLSDGDGHVVTRRVPDDATRADLLFAMAVCRHVKSNAIVLARDGATVGIGAGQMSRIDSARIAIGKAGERAAGAVAASDAFFPFADGVEVLAQAGITAIVQPGGSLRDAEVIEAADAAGIAMIATGMRNFRH